MVWRLYSAVLLAGFSLLSGRQLYAQQDPLALLAAGEREIASGNLAAARQQIAAAVSMVKNEVFPRDVTRQVVLRAAESDAQMSDFDQAASLSRGLQGMGDLTPDETARVQRVLAQCSMGQQRALVVPGEREIANGNYIAARQQILGAVARVRSEVFEPPVVRQVVLRGAEIEATMANFDDAVNLSHGLQGLGALTQEEQLRVQIVLAQSALGRDDLRAAAAAAEAIEAILKLPRLEVNPDWSANALAELAEVRRLEGNSAEARRLSALAVTASEGRLNSPALSIALIAPPQISFSLGQLADARRLAEGALAGWRTDHPIALMLREILARLAIEDGRLPDAAGFLEGLTETARARLGPSHPFTIDCLLTEAAYAGRRGAWSEARAKIEDASGQSGLRPVNHALRLRLLLYSADTALALNRLDDAAGYLAQAAPLATGGNPVQTAAVLNAQAAVAIERKNYDDAEKMLRNAGSLLSSVTEETLPARMRNTFETGLLYARWGDAERADAPLLKWIGLRPNDADDLPQAVALSILGHNAFRRKDYDRCAALMSASIEIRNSVGGLSPAEMSAEYEALGLSLDQSGKLDAAVAALQHALNLKGRVAPTVADLDLYRALSETLESLGKTTEALPYFDIRLRLMNQADPLGSEEALRLADHVALLHARQSNFAAAEPLLLQLYDAGLMGRGPAARDRSDILARLGDTETHLGHFARAASVLDELARIDLLNKQLPDAEQVALRARDAARQSPGTPDLASALNVLADIALAQGKPDDAKALYLQAAADPGANSRTRAIGLNGQGRIALGNRDWAGADQLLDQAFAAIKDDANPSPGLEALIVANRAVAQESTGHVDEANASYARFLELEPRSHPPQDPPLLNQLDEAARFFSLQPGRAADVLEVYNRRADSSKRIFGEQSDEYAWALFSLAEYYTNNKRYEDAIPPYTLSSHLFEQSFGIQSDQVRTVRGPMADAYLATGNVREAIQLIEPVLPAAPDMSNDTQVALLDQLAGLYRKVGDPNRAIAIYRQLIDASAKQSPVGQNPKWLGATQNLIAATIEKGDSKAANTLFKAARESIHRGAGGKDSLSEVHLLRAYAAALRKSGRDKNDKKQADTYDANAEQMEKHLLGS